MQRIRRLHADTSGILSILICGYRYYHADSFRHFGTHKLEIHGVIAYESVGGLINMPGENGATAKTRPFVLERRR
jgi:hypothetical protein